MEQQPPPRGGGHLSAEAIRLYGRLAECEGQPCEPSSELDELVAWGVVTFDPDRSGVPVVLEPLKALRGRARRELDHIVEQAAFVARLPRIVDQLAVHFDRTKWTSGSGSQFLGDPAAVNARLQHTVASAEEEILAAQPGGPRSRELMNIAVERDSAALRRGVRLRTLYRDSVRDDAVTREWAQTMAPLGAAYRTLAGPFQRCIVIDRRTAFISDSVVPNSPPHAAWLVEDRAMVAFIAETFEENWRRATPWRGEARTVDEVGGEGVTTTALQRAILRDNAAGLEQRVTAERLGMSLRSLQRELADLRMAWGAPTLAALAYLWASSPDRLVEDGPAEASRPAA